MITRILPFAALIFAGAIVFGYIMPTYNTSITTVSKRIASYESALSAAQKFKDKEAQLETERAAIDPANLARLEAFMPDGVNNVQLILDLDGLAARSGMTLSNFNIDASKVVNGSTSGDPSSLSLQADSPVDSLELTVTATGTYAQFRAFLAGIEHSLRPMDVTAVNITGGGATPGQAGATAVYKYTMTIRIYWLH